MEKVKFSDLKSELRECEQSYTLNIGKHTIEIKEELTIQEQIEFAEYLFNKLLSEDDKYFNKIKFEYYKVLAYYKFFTSIDISDYTDEELHEVYNIINTSGELRGLNTESIFFNCICREVEDMLKDYYNYRNSIYGILDVISTDYENLNLDMSTIKENMIDKDNLTLLKDVVTKLG